MQTPTPANDVPLRLGESGATANTRIANVLRHVEKLPTTPGSLLIGVRDEPQGLIFVERNRVCWAAARGLGQRLCDILRDHSHIRVSDADFTTLYAHCRAAKTPIGEELVKRGMVTPDELRASLRQHTAESMLHIDEAVANSGELTWPATWVDRVENSHHPRFTFATAEVLAAVGTVQSDRDIADVTNDHLGQVGGFGCSAIAFRVDDDVPVLLSVAMTATLFVDDALSLAGWAEAAMGACGGFSPAMIHSMTATISGGGVLAWTYEAGTYAAVTPNVTSLRRLVSFVDHLDLPMVLSTKLPLLQRLRDRGVGA